MSDIEVQDASTNSVTKRLEVLEGVIERGLTTFVEVGNAIREIRDARLYRDKYPTFEHYCRERWGWSSSRSRQMIGAAQAVETVTTVTPVAPANEAQARELAPLARKDPEAAREVWAAVVEDAYGDATKIAAKDVKEAVQRRVFKAKDDPHAVDICHPCGGSGEVENGGAIVRCEACGGSGFVPRSINPHGIAAHAADARPNPPKEVVRAGKEMYLVVRFSNNTTGTVHRSFLLENGWKRCPCCKGNSVVSAEEYDTLRNMLRNNK